METHLEQHDIAYLSGFLAGICDHIAVEQTGLRPGSEEVFHRSIHLQSAYQGLILPAWMLVIEANDPIKVSHRLLQITPNNEQLEPHVPKVAGYVIGAACAGYTMIGLCSEKNALDIRTGELWVARKRLTKTDDTISYTEDVDDEVRLVDLTDADGTFVRLRWSGDDDPDADWLRILGAALPSSFATPLIGLEQVRESFERAAEHRG